MAAWTTWNGEIISAKIREAGRLGLLDAAIVILEAARQEVPLDEGVLLHSGTVFITPPGDAKPEASTTFGGGGTTGQPRIPYALHWHENSANFQHGRKKRYLADPHNRLAGIVAPAAINRRFKAAGL